LPVAFRSLPFSRFKIRSGGTFLKFFPASTLVSILKSCDSEGIVPMLYLHPYEFITDNSFVLGLGDMGSLPFYKKYYWLLRQFQWLGFTNSSVQGRILSIYEHFEMGGHMKSLLKSC
jgi:hypothetical protein